MAASAPAAQRHSATVFVLPRSTSGGASAFAVWGARLQEPTWATVIQLDDHYHCQLNRCKMGQTPSGSWRRCAHIAEVDLEAALPDELPTDVQQQQSDDAALDPLTFEARGPRRKPFLRPPARVLEILACARTNGLAASLALCSGRPEPRFCVCGDANALIPNYWPRVPGERKPDHCRCGAKCHNCGSEWNFEQPVPADKVWPHVMKSAHAQRLRSQLLVVGGSACAELLTYNVPCTHCAAYLEYDGDQDGLFVTSAKHAFTYAPIQGWLRSNMSHEHHGQFQVPRSRDCWSVERLTRARRSCGCCKHQLWSYFVISWYASLRVLPGQQNCAYRLACLHSEPVVTNGLVCPQQQHDNDARLTPRIFFSAFWSCLRADDIDLEMAFTCPVCGPLTEAPCCVWDAVKAAIEFKRLRGRLPQILQLFRDEHGGPRRVGTRHASRLCLADAGVRNLLRRWCEVQRQSRTDAESTKSKPLTQAVR